MHKALQNCAWSNHGDVEPRTSTDEKASLLDPKGLGEPPLFSSTEEDFYVWARKVENCVSGVFPNVRGVLAGSLESQDAVTATAVALGVPELEAEMSTEIDGQLFMVLSSRTVRASTL